MTPSARRVCLGLLLCSVGCATAPTRGNGVRGDDDLPIVLAHGLSGFRTFSGISYFYGVPDDLKERGHRVFATAVPPWGSVQTRATQLARQVDSVLSRTHAPRVHIVAHSMGGLDARYIISKLGYGSKVATLTTVSTPHRGSPIADGYSTVNLKPFQVLQDFGADFWVWTLGGIKVHNDTGRAVEDLSVRVSSAFNQDVVDDPRVAYFSFAGRTLGHDGKGFCDDSVWPNPDETNVVHPLLLTTAVALSGTDLAHPIANDGLVQVPSARWGTFMGCLPADHMKEVGQPMALANFPGRWDHRSFYIRWAEELVSGQARSHLARPVIPPSAGAAPEHPL
jgi:triacylglycerol lipase